MGYIFDALNRAGKIQRPDSPPAPPGQPPQQAPPPADADQDDALRDQTLDGGAEAEAQPIAAGISPRLGVATPVDANPEGDVQAPQPQPRNIAAQILPGIDDRLVALTEPSSLMAEEYRAIRTGLLARWQHKRHLIHTITSATPQEGKTITSLNLGLCLAELRNRKTIVVEADLRLPQFQKLLEMPDTPGLVGCLTGGARLEDAIFQPHDSALHVLAAGRRASTDAVQLLSSAEMTGLLKKLKRAYDHVIIDTPPVVELADAGIIGAQSDDVLLIVRMGRTPRTLVEQAKRTLGSYNAPVAGLIATDQQRSRRDYKYYRYGYRYPYTSGRRAA